MQYMCDMCCRVFNKINVVYYSTDGYCDNTENSFQLCDKCYKESNEEYKE